MERIVLAYSGGLDTSIAIRWLKENYAAEIVAVTLDLGQREELEGVRDRALAAGARRAHVLDLREEFARGYILPTLKADAVYDDGCPMAKALSRPLIARKLVEIAEIEGARTVAHGSTSTSRDQMRFETALRALNRHIKVVVPVRDWGMTRSERIEYARRRGVPLPDTTESPYSTDSNLWGRSIECRSLREGLWLELPEELYSVTRSAASCPDEPAYVELTFERGVPIAINDVAMTLVDLIASLNTIAGGHGVGRIDMVNDQPSGISPREIYEAPAAVVLHAAHRELQKLVTAKELYRFSRAVSLEYAAIVNGGSWFEPMRKALDAFVATVQEQVTGTVRLRLFKGDARAVGSASPHALHGAALATDERVDLQLPAREARAR